MPRVSFSTPSLCLTIFPLLNRLLPSLPPTVRDREVPPQFRKCFILAGYRPVGLPWRCYILSLFQMHNETLNVWSHLLAAVCMVLRFMVFAVLQGGGVLGFRLQGPEGQGLSVDVSSLPLVLYLFSAVTYLSFSTAAHLLQSHSESVHFSLFFLDYVGVAIGQYGCAIGMCIYSADAAWTQSMLGQIYLPAAALLSWFSCTACCYAKIHFQQPNPLRWKLYQLILMGIAYLLDISPVLHRLFTHSWKSCPALMLHLLQVVLFMMSAFFFFCSAPERFWPGRFDIIGHSQQIFHVLLSFCALVEQEALFHDFLCRRPALVREFGEEHLLLACVSFPCLMIWCTVTAVAMRRHARTQLLKEQR
ncbi:membrane progestin receptor beta-like [Xenentodon cancila]